MMQKVFITKNSEETQKLGLILAKKLRGGKIIALQGELGSGKTTFSQGFLGELKIKGPYTSPTFVLLKHYRKIKSQKPKVKILSKKQKVLKSEIQNIYHIDAYRINSKNILNLGWEEIIADKNNVIIVEWADRIKKIIPECALWIKFEWVDNNTRKIKLYENKII